MVMFERERTSTHTHTHRERERDREIEREIAMYIHSKNVHKSDYDKRQN
jgi:hypothetical protein